MNFIKKHLATIITWAVIIAILASLVIYIALRPTDTEGKFAALPAEVYDPATALDNKVEMVNDKEYALLQKDGKIEFYMCLTTGDFFVQDLATGDRHFSTPQGTTNQLYMSNLNMSCFSSDPEKPDERDSYSDAVKHSEIVNGRASQVSVAKTDKGIRVGYTMGIVWKDYVVPLSMPKDEYEKIYNSELLDDIDRKRLAMRYKLYEAGTEEVISSELMQQYPLLKIESQYVYSNVINVQQPPSIDLATYEKVFTKAGMTLEQALAFNSQMQVNTGFSDVYRVYIDYVINDGSLEVTIPTQDIWTQDKMEYKISKIDLLRYFGAGTAEDTGYLVLPDRSGTLMYFNKGKSNQGNIVIPAYGLDHSVIKTYANPSQSVAYLPVFGIKRNNSAIFAVVEEGAEICNFTADVAKPGAAGTVNYVYPSFELTPQDQVEMREMSSSEASDLANLKAAFYQEDAYTGDIKVRYHFLSGEKASWSGMAEQYRQDLEADGIISRMTEESDLPMLVDLVGSIETTKSVVGIPTDVALELTTFEQAQELLSGLKSKGVSGLNARFKGWANGGMLSSYYNDVKPLKVLGGKKGFESLAAYTKANNIGFYPDAEFLYIYTQRAFDGFRPNKHTARSLTKSLAYKYVYSPVTGKIDKENHTANILKPSLLVDEVKSFLSAYSAYSVTGLSAASLGTDANSDFNNKAYITRSQSIGYNIQAVEEIKKSQLSFMVDGGNDYMVKYADVIANAPIDDSNFYVSDETIPFYAAVFHGYIPYISPALNQQDDEHVAFLKAVEMGAGLSYIWMYADNKELKGVSFELGYSLNYKQWYDGAAEYYKKANAALKPLSDELITDHYRLMAEKDIFVTVYGNGTKVYVNYTDSEVEAEGVKIPALDFVVSGN